MKRVLVSLSAACVLALCVVGIVLVVRAQTQAQAARQLIAAGPANLAREETAARQAGIPLTATQLQQPLPPPSQNAAPLYVKLTKLLHDKPFHLPEYAEGMDAFHAYTPEQIAVVRRTLAARQDVMTLVHQAADKPQCVFVRDWNKGLDLDFPEYQPMHKAARLIKDESYLLARDRHYKEAVVNQARGFRVAKHAASDPALINSNYKGTITLTNCTVTSNNEEYFGGGGIYNSNGNDGTITMTNCAVIGNSIGGVLNDNNGSNENYGTITLTNCAITGNTGSGVNNSNSNVNGTANPNITLTNCTITSNTNGGVSNFNDFVGIITLTNCTVSGNTGGGVNNEVYGYDPIILTNNIIYGDTGGEVSNGNGATATAASVCDIQGGYLGSGNIDKDPLFVNAAAGDLHLKSGSPCLGKGTPNGAPTRDLDGNTRPNPPSMGAYELVTGSGSTAIHLTADNITGDADGIVCDNLNGMDVSLKDTLTVTLDDPNAVITDASLTNPDGTVTDRHTHPNVGSFILLQKKLVYYPPDEFNFEQQPQGVGTDDTGNDWITKNATRKVTLAVHYTSGSGSYTLNKDIILARPPVVLVHGINSNPSNWQPLVGGVTDNTVQGHLGVSVPFVSVNHADPRTFGDPLDQGNAPIEIGAQLLSERVSATLNSVRSGTMITDADENNVVQDGVYQFAGYVGASLAAKRVDVVAWSYGGVITRWYIGTKPIFSASWYKRPFAYARQKNGVTTTYSNTQLPETTYNGDIRKVITLGSMWRGVPLSNYLNETILGDSYHVGLYNAPFLPFPTLGYFIDNVFPYALPTTVPSMEVLGVESKWLSYLIYGEHFPTPKPFDDNISYGAIGGDSSRYLAADLGPLHFTYNYTNPYTAIDQMQSPSWFPYLGLEYLNDPQDAVNGAMRNYSDGVVPLWSSLLPGVGSSDIINTIHSSYPSAPQTWRDVVVWLNGVSLPQGNALNNVWSDPNSYQIQSYGRVQTWTFSPIDMAPYPQSDIYKQINGVARINPQALGGDGYTYPGVVKPHLFALLARNGANTVVNISVLNAGSVLIPDVQIIGVTIQAGSVITLNPNIYGLGTLPVGGSTNTSVPFTGFLGASGTSVVVKVTYTYALSNGTNTLAFRAKLP